MSLTIDDIASLFRSRGHEQYDGEPVTQLEHALQAGHLAEQAGADSALISAAFLHDIGHLLHDFGPTPTMQGTDDVHQYRCLPFLRPLFSSATLEPIKLHVEAKRYLCAVDPAYYGMLSEDSRRSLVLQGGIFNPEQVEKFAALPYAQAAIDLRRWDDLAKVNNAPTPGLVHFMTHLIRAYEMHRSA